MKTNELFGLENRLGAKNYKPLDVILRKGKGIWVWDVEGKKYTDCLPACSAVNHGQCQRSDRVDSGYHFPCIKDLEYADRKFLDTSATRF